MNLAHISSSLIFIITITTLTGEKLNNCDDPNDIYLPYYAIPVHYRIKLIHLYIKTNNLYLAVMAKLNLKNQYNSFNFHGESSTTINILQSTQYIKLHKINLFIIPWKITMIKNNGIIYVLKYEQYSKMLVFQTSSVFFPGLYTLKMEFIGQLTEYSAKSFFRSFYTNKENGIAWLLASHIQANGVSQLFPCWDEPYLKATFTISMMHHRSFTVLFNMPLLIHHTSDDNNFIWTQFCTTPPMSTFQIAMVITNYPHVHINENIHLWCEKCSEYNQSLKFARRVIENITLHLQSEFNGINIPKMDHVALPNFLHDDTSKWGLIFHREIDLIYDEQLDSVMRKMEVARLIASKIAYQWFSNIFSLSHFWLHDGLATLFAEEAIVETFQNAGIMNLFIVQNQYESLHLDSDFDMIPLQINNLSEIDFIFNFPRYMKVLIVLRMFQNAITDETFRKNIQTYLYKHMFSSMISCEFSSIQEILTSFIYIPYNVSNEFLIWINYKNYPVVNWKRETSLYGKLSQNFNINNDKWWIPIKLILKFFSFGTLNRVLSSQEPSINVFHTIQDDWIMVDIQQAGYYRVNYDLENWQKIIYYLNNKSGEYKDISVINRAKMIDDAFHLMIEHQLNVSIFWELTKYLSQETDYVAWYPMIKVFEYMSTIFPFLPSKFGYIDITKKFRKLLDQQVKTLGFKENVMDSDFTKCLRQEIVKWACTLNHPDCAIATYYELHHYFQNPEKYPVLSEWKQWTYCKSLFITNITCEVLTDRLSRKSVHKLLPFLACCVMKYYNITENLSHFFDQFISDRKQDIKIVRSQIHFFFSIMMKFVDTRPILHEVLLNLPIIKPEEIKTLTALTVVINNIYNVELLQHINLKRMEILCNVNKLCNVEQFLMIQDKLTKRNLEIEKHVKHFQFINV